MATFSERKIQRLVDSLRNLTREELGKYRKIMETYEPEQRDGKVGFLDLPAEIRNMIYQYVAADAHASAVAPVGFTLFDGDQFGPIRDRDGRKIRPGLFGTCREVFREFHSIFYSRTYVKAKILLRHTDWQNVLDSAMLDAIVNDKHVVTASRFIRTPAEFEATIADRDREDDTVHGGREIMRADGSTAIIYFSVYLCMPWIDRSGVKVDEWSMSNSCLTLATSTEVPTQGLRCALCLMSMGNERAASPSWYYG